MYLSWVVTDDRGQQKCIDKCAILVVSEEIPRIKGAVEGLQSGVNEARNRSIETRATVDSFVGGMINLVAHKAIEP